MEPDSPDRRQGSKPTTPLRVDDLLVRPETREEMVRGRMIYAAPALPPHADRHQVLGFVTESCMAPGYVASTDLLTRVGPRSHFATDTCIRREGIDPDTGSRHLEELAFEIVNGQSRRHVTERAEDLSQRGVRRIIAIFVKREEVCEWSPERNEWIVLDPNGVLEDPTLAEPLPIRAILDRSEAHRTAIRGFRTKGHPEIRAIQAEAKEQGHAEGRAEGLTEAWRTAIEALCEALDIPLDPDRRAALHRLDMRQVEDLLGRIRRERRWS